MLAVVIVSDFLKIHLYIYIYCESKVCIWIGGHSINDSKNVHHKLACLCTTSNSLLFANLNVDSFAAAGLPYNIYVHVFQLLIYH